ncbi:MAG: hypothetical protein AAF236_16080 [Verrucomicrobiota bacterium]
MSVIAAVRKNGVTAIACDGLASLGSLKIRSDNCPNTGKLVKTDTWIAGVVGWAVMQDTLEHLSHSKPELFDFSSRQKVFDTLLRIQPVLEDEYFLETKEDDEQPVSSSQLTALVVTPDSIFEIESYRAVFQYNKYWAVGAGDRFALGALHALYDTVDDAEELARRAVAAACYFHNSCELPVDCEAFRQ